MRFLINLVLLPLRYVLVLLGGLRDVGRLMGMLFRAWRADAKAGIGAVLASTDGQRLLFGVMRVFWANLVIGKVLVKAYDNNGTAIVTRDADVREVLERDADFAVVYEPRMRKITAGDNFFLGMQDSPEYQHDVSIMRLAARWEDVSQIIVPFVSERATAAVSAADGRLDVPADLTLPTVTQMVSRYFGLPLGGQGQPSEADLIDWTSIMFWYLFIDLGADPKVDRKAMDAASACRAYLDDVIAARKAAPTDADDVLNRCLDLQRAGTLGFDDLAIRNNIIGLIIGAIPTISRAATQALDQLLDRPEALAEASSAAKRGDDDLLGRCVFEALRFNPVNPFIYRRCVADTIIAAGTLRARRVPKDNLVLAANLSAMFDPWSVQDPEAFRSDRPWDQYMLWGYALHTCFGAHINRAVVPLLLKPLLAAGDLRRAAGEAGAIDTAGTPFPAHMSVELR